MTAEPGSTVVVGAGIAGLTAALALAQRGRPVEIWERAERLLPVGAGIQISPNAIRVLARIGVAARLAPHAVAAKTVTLRSGRSGRAIAEVPVEGSDGTGYLAVHRGDLQDALLAAVDGAPLISLRLGREVTRASPAATDVELEFRDGANGALSRRSAEWVFGADGVRSALAASLGLPAPRPTGLVVARFSALVDRDAAADRGIEAWLGPGRHAVAYPVSGGSQINLVVIGPRLRAREDAAWALARWDPRLRALVDRAEFNGVWPLLQSEPDRRMVHGRLILIGDAAHAMLPFAAQGAAMAIEDAWCLAETLWRGTGEGNGAETLGDFQKKRLARLHMVRKRVAFHQKVYHLPPPLAQARDLALRMRSKESLRRDLAWLYDWAPTDRGDETAP